MGPAVVPASPKSDAGYDSTSAQDIKVFWFFFSKKNCFLPLLRDRHAGFCECCCLAGGEFLFVEAVDEFVEHAVPV